MSANARKQRLYAKPESERQATFERQRAVMEMYSDNAKTYVQLSSLALALTLTFADKILRTQRIVDKWTVTMWTCFLIAIIVGAFYQFLAVKQLDSLLEWEYDKTWDWLQPGIVYGVMLAAFYAGTIIFTIYAIIQIKKA